MPLLRPAGKDHSAPSATPMLTAAQHLKLPQLVHE